MREGEREGGREGGRERRVDGREGIGGGKGIGVEKEGERGRSRRPLLVNFLCLSGVY